MLYRFVQERRWTDALGVLHRQHRTVAEDPLLNRAAATFVTAFFDDLADPESHADALEKLFLLHTGGFYRLSGLRFEQVVETLVTLYADRPDAAVGFARFCPDNERCATVLHRYAPPEPTVHAPADGRLTVSSTRPRDGTDATISLFKSDQEVDFFLAVREVFATYLVYPNVALSCLVDFDRVRDGLTPEARRYFFRGVVDCVVFDQHDVYRPRHFFELDSPHHDDPDRRARDRHKEHILALAGQTLHRIRTHASGPRRSAFAALLRTLRDRAEGE